jgi:glycosyltransferase involved in cell wall biosynthesis
MNIGVDIRPLMAEHRTGVGEYVYELLNAIFEIDQKNQYFLFYNASAESVMNFPNWKKENVHIVGTRWSNKFLNASIAFSGQPKLDQFLLRNCSTKIDKLDYFFSPNLNFTSISDQVKHILTIHDLSYEFFSDCFSPKDRLWHKAVRPRAQAKRADLILVPSENTKQDVVSYYGVSENKVKVIYPGVSSNFLSNLQNPTLFKKYILYLGTIESRKNVSAVVEAYQAAKKQYPEVMSGYELVLAGAIGYGGQKIIEEAKKISGVSYIGYVPAEEKFNLYKNASLFVFPSLYEGFGFPVVEAFAAGLPVVTSNRSSLAEVSGPAAYLVNPLSARDISEAMIKLLQNEKILLGYNNKGLERVSFFSWRRAAELFLTEVEKM